MALIDDRQRQQVTGIELENLTKKYADNLVLDDVSLSIAPGTVTALIGPSGAGKTTLLRCINLLEKPNHGIIRAANHVIDTAREISNTDLAALRREVGMVFQSFNLFSHLNVLNNITFAQRKVLRRSREESIERAFSLLKRMGLEDKAKSLPAQCSGGQQQRIAIARALALEPKVMLFDEPTSSLDPELGAEVLAVMRELAREGMTMIVVTHEMQFAKEVSDELVVMADCKILEKGDPRVIMESPSQPRTQAFLQAVLHR